MNPTDGTDENTLTPSLLEQMGIEKCFHGVISELCGGRLSYVYDITADDFIEGTDSNGARIPPAVARGLVRKIQTHQMKTDSSNDPPSEGKYGDEGQLTGSEISSFGAARPCEASLLRGNEEFASLVRCSVRGKLRQNTAETTRRKVLTAVLDNSGSMRNHWRLVVDALTKVFTDELLNDQSVTLKAVAYNTEAEEVALPRSSSQLSSLLLGRFWPGGITNFKSAFELAEDLIGREVTKLKGEKIPVSAIDVTTLIFTDGADTSVPPLGYPSEAAATKARKAGDNFQSFLKGLGCSAYTCVAAFGEGHSPEQCQYLGDRYFYINRREVLSEWLMGGLSDLLRSSGSCSLSLQLPSRLDLLEPLPKAIQLDSKGSFDYEIWLQDKAAGSATIEKDDTIRVGVEENGKLALSCTLSLSSSGIAHNESLQGRLFLLDAGEMQLRQIALELRGNRSSPTALAALRERLVGVQGLLQPVSAKASNPKARLIGRSLLLSRVEELETRRNRLSYTLGHFEEETHGDTRKIGAVGIDAVLRDVSQRVPLGPDASRYARRAEKAVAMGCAENLSQYGKEITFDSLSGCDAKQAADQGDALFFCFSDPSFSSDGSILTAKDCRDAPVAYEVYTMISTKKGMPPPESFDASKTQLGIPLYASADHFARVRLFLPEVLQGLSPGNYEEGKSERLLLDLLGQTLAAQLFNVQSSQSSRHSPLALIHKARSVHAVFETTKSLLGENSLLDEVLDEAKMFVEDKEKREDTKNLYSVAAVGLLAEGWSPCDIVRLGEAVIEESLRRAIKCKLAGKSTTAKIQLAWGLLGGNDGSDNEWLNSSLGDITEESHWSEGFDIIAVGPEMENLETSSPQQYCPRDPGILPSILCSPVQPGTLRAKEWSALRHLLSQWGSVNNVKKKKRGSLWSSIDDIMVNDSAECRAALDRIGTAMHLEQEARTLEDVLPDPTGALSFLAAECLEGSSSDKGSERESLRPVRLELASVTNALVKERERLARKYPIVGAEYPSVLYPSESKLHEIWGAQAHPVDEELYSKVRRSVHREKWNRPLSVREALTDKWYRKRGGTFRFPTRLDSFIPGLHRRTKDLHHLWGAKSDRQTQGVEARQAAVAEMLLRLPWDDSDECARRKLSMIVGAIWDGLNGLPSGAPLASALWIDDDVDESEGARIGEIASNNGDGDDWDVL